jgi:electron transfer flavoprotein alpha subunit
MKTILFAENVENYQTLCGYAGALGAEATALYVGPAAGADQIAALGAKVINFGERPEGTLLECYAGAFKDAIAAEGADLALFYTSKRAQCIAGKVAAMSGVAVVNDTATIQAAADGIELSRNVYGGAASQVVKASGLVIALVGEGLLEPVALSGSGSVEAGAEVSCGCNVKVVAVEPKAEAKVNLGAAKLIVGVGRGISSEDNLHTAEGIAAQMGAEIACTRPIAEGEGWLPTSRYLGVSGATVKPDLYLALGISGQVQHLVGINESKTIIAVNKDKSAPIFKHCDVGLVADIQAVLPALQAAF